MTSRLLVIVLMFAVTSVVPTAQPAFKSSTQGVRLDVLVSGGTGPINGLRADDFEVRDNGVLQEIAIAELADSPIKLILAVDVSGSVRGPRVDALRSAGMILLKDLREQDEVALIAFNHSPFLQLSFTSDVRRIEEALTKVEASGRTAMVDAALASLLLAESGEGRSLVVILSDGVDTASHSSPDSLLDTARAANTVMYGIWSGREKRPRILSDVAETSGGRLIDVSGSADVADALANILREFRQRYLITFKPTGIPANEWHKLDVRVKRRATVTARRGYFSRN